MGKFYDSVKSWSEAMISYKGAKNQDQRHNTERQLKSCFDNLISGLLDDKNWDDKDQEAYDYFASLGEGEPTDEELAKSKTI